MANPSSGGAPREDEARLTGARAEFVGSLPRRLDALRAALRSAEEAPADPERAIGLIRRVHAVGAAARVLGFASVAEALSEAEKAVRKATSAGRVAPFEDVARALDLLPSLVLGAPVSMRAPETREPSAAHVWPISVLVYGAPLLADMLGSGDDDTRIEREHTDDPGRARELARVVGPDVVVIDADRQGARELVAELARDPLVEPVPLVIVGSFDQPEAASAFVELGAARVLLKPCSPDTLRRTVEELRDRASKPRAARDPVGQVTVPALADRIANEFKRGLVDALEGSQAMRVALGDGHDVLAAVWGAVARVRELVTLHSGGDLRFQPTGPEGASPLAPWSAEERRAGERSRRESRTGDGVSLNGRTIVVADDDPAVVWFMAGLLKAVGAEVIEAHDGKQALELVYSRFPDAVISDVLMPKLDGFSLCREIKRDVAVRDVPVILLSWKEDLLQRLRELGADADGYLRKEAAASAVVERVREVLHSRARVEERLLAGGEVRGRLDGLTPRLVLELACRAASDVRVSFRDAAFLYEAQIRRGGLRSVTRSAPDGSFLRGDGVLPSLLGVTAGRFVVEPDSSPCRAELSGDLRASLSKPIANARAALERVSERSLVRLERLELDRELVHAYLECTPEPAAELTRRLLAGEGARDMVLSGEVAPRLLEAVLSDIARRGGVLESSLSPSTSIAPGRAPEARSESPVHAALAADGAPPEGDAEVGAPQAAQAPRTFEPEPDSDSLPSTPGDALAVDHDDVGWFSLAVEPSADPPPAEARDGAQAKAAPEPPYVPSDPPLRVVGAEPKMPLSDHPTPGNWQVGPLFAFGGEHATLPGVGELPRVTPTATTPDSEPAPAPSTAVPAPNPPSDPAPEPVTDVAPEPAPDAAPEPATDVAPEPAPDAAPEPATDVAPEPATAAASPAEEDAPDLEILTPLRAHEDDDDDRVTFPIPERSPVPASRAAASQVPTSPIPEPLPIINERSAPTEPPSRVGRKPAKPLAEKERKGSVVGFLLQSVVWCVVAFLAMTYVVLPLFGGGERSEPAPEEKAAEPIRPSEPAPAGSAAPETPSGLALRSEPMEPPAGVSLDPVQGLVEIELSEAGSIKVDDAPMGRFDRRRLLLAPGPHRIEVEGDRGSGVLDLDVVAGRAVRVSDGTGAPAKSAAPSAE
jgi:DNA-binding response OmpR family regulator